MNLFQISQEYQQIINEIYDEDGVINDQALARLEQNDLDHEKKSIAVASWIQNMTIEKASLVEAKRTIDQMKKNVLDRERTLENKIDRMKTYLRDGMQVRGITQIKCPLFVLNVRKNPGSVDVLDENQIPDEYWVVSKSLNRSKILQDLKDNISIPGAMIKESMRLDIK